MKDFFEPEDFCDIGYAEMDYASDQANKKLEKLIESWPVVYGRGNQWDQTDGRPDSYVGCTHKARLAFIEEIKKECVKHEPEEFEFSLIIQGYLLGGLPNTFHEDKKSKIVTANKCKHCGVELQATWSEKK